MFSRTFRTFALTGAVVLATASPAAASNDTFSSRQWNMRKVRSETAWSTGRGAGVTIAIVDTGVDLGHEDLRGAFVPGHDFVDKDADPSDANGHGTHVAGIAAARANNKVGVAGVAPEAAIMPIRVLDATGRGIGIDIDDGVHWAVDHGADVVNLSLGDNVIIEDVSGGSLTDAVDYAWSKGVIPVISAGNDALFRTELRGAKALIVTATAPDNTAPTYATGVGVAPWGISAPGGTDTNGTTGEVFSTFWTASGRSHYGWAIGTSMAAPHVAGAAAILRGLGLSPQQTVDRILSTAKDIGMAGNDVQFGAGLLDVTAAVAGLGKGSPKPSGGNNGGGSATQPSPNNGGSSGSGLRPKRLHRPTSSTQGSTNGQASATSSPDARNLATDDKPQRSGVPALVLVLVLGSVGLGPVAYGSYRLMRARSVGERR